MTIRHPLPNEPIPRELWPWDVQPDPDYTLIVEEEGTITACTVFANGGTFCTNILAVRGHDSHALFPLLSAVRKIAREWGSQVIVCYLEVGTKIGETLQRIAARAGGKIWTESPQLLVASVPVRKE